MTKLMEHNLDTQYIFCIKCYFSGTTKWVSQSFPVLAMLTKGKGKLLLNDQSGPEFQLKLQQPFFLPANLRRKPEAENQEGFEILALGFLAKISEGIDLLNFLEIPMFFNTKISDRLGELMLEIYSLETNKKGNWLKEAAAKKRILYEIVENILAALPATNETVFSFMKNFHCLPAVKYLQENFKAPLNIPKLIKLCSLSRTHFFRLFKEQTNSTPFEYIKNRRLQEAQNMLLCTNLSISEIGDRVGWPDQFHFSRIFKKKTGLSPNNYRRQFKL